MTKSEKQPEGVFIKLTPLPERGKFTSLAMTEEIASLRASEIERWRRAQPDLFEGDKYNEWRLWIVNLLTEGLYGIGSSGNLANQAIALENQAKDYALILTQEGYPFHNLPESWALASTLSFDLALNLMGKEGFHYEKRDQHAIESQLIGWLIDNPKRIEA